MVWPQLATKCLHSCPVFQRGLPPWAAVPFGRYQLRHLLIPGPQSLWRCDCSSMGPPQATEPLRGAPALWWGASAPLAFLFPLFIPLFYLPLYSLALCSFLFSLSSVFCRSLNTFSQRHHTCAWWVQLWPVVRPLWSALESTVCGTKQPWPLPLEATPVATLLPKPCDLHPIHKAIINHLVVHLEITTVGAMLTGSRSCELWEAQWMGDMVKGTAADLAATL